MPSRSYMARGSPIRVRVRVSARDALLLFIGAFTMHLVYLIMGPVAPVQEVSTHVQQVREFPPSQDILPPPEEVIPLNPPSQSPIPPHISHTLPETEVLDHAPGYTLFQDIYMHNGTLFVVTSQPPSSFPERRKILSVPLIALNEPENIRAREPTDHELKFITPREAKALWGVPSSANAAITHRVITVAGNTFMVYDPQQFLSHYYHFVAETFLGMWAFWVGTNYDPSIEHQEPKTVTDFPAMDRMILPFINSDGWHDDTGFNPWFLRAVFPSIAVETMRDWKDRIASTLGKNTSPDSRAELYGPKAWHFPKLLLNDRSAAFRGEWCGAKTARIAAEPYEYFRNQGTLPQTWWDHVRNNVQLYAGVSGRPHKIVVAYISRQRAHKRKLTNEDHDALVRALRVYVNARNAKRFDEFDDREWELVVPEAEYLSKDEQVQLFSRTSFLLGVHGNGLTNMLYMFPSAFSTVVEFFAKDCFARDYQWTANALGHLHYAVWNTHYEEAEPSQWPNYPDQFNANDIRVDAKTIVSLIQKRWDATHGTTSQYKR